MNKKLIVAGVVALTFIGLGFLVLSKDRSTDTQLQESKIDKVPEDPNKYLLADYPINEVPLIKEVEISSMKYFVNDDTSSSYLYGGPVNYFNVVFETEANRNETFAFYRDLMSQVYPDEGSEGKLVGQIDKYKVYVSQHQPDSDTIYMQVALPLDEFNKTNIYYSEYPSLVELDQSWIEKESSYGLLNQRGGEIGYTQYFVLDEDELDNEVKEKPFSYFYDKYKDIYQDKDGFESNDEESMLSWQENNYEVTMTFSEDHGRVYLMIRKPLNE